LVYKGYKDYKGGEWNAVVLSGNNSNTIKGWTPRNMSYSAHSYKINSEEFAKEGFGKFDSKCNFIVKK
jgi:hypothetical protein